ncbi:DUF4339 domain-containing protein [Pendulispora albinea]|uniref:DUF4339 domain-containing protein n=1 Tax=Pendulispora albinea TaxID=2741071 RepID=A0ABZ2M630_9BACT
MPYRETAERPKLAPEERRFFTKRDDVEKGPFERGALLRAIRAGKLHRATLVRAEDESEWRPLSYVKQIDAEVAPAPKVEFDAARHLLHDEDSGSFGKGIVIGLLGGCGGWILAEIFAKGRETKRGARIGFVVQLVGGIFLRLVLGKP